MSLIVLLDAGPLGLVTNPRGSPEATQCSLWLESLLASEVPVRVPEIADYEVRRELLRAGKSNGIRRLDELKAAVGYLPIDTPAMLRAAELWAQARQQGHPTADDKALDADVILAAQAATLADGEVEPIIATTNVGHLARFADARNWQEIGT